MKTFYRLSTALLLVFTLGLLDTPKVLAQCPGPYNNFPNFEHFNLTPTGIGDTARVNAVWGGDFHHINVDSGKTYVISMCETVYFSDPMNLQFSPDNEIDFNPQITLVKDSVGDSLNFIMPSGPIVGYADDVCGVNSNLMPRIQYTADFTGNLAVIVDPVTPDLVNGFGCDSFAIDSARMFVTQIPTTITASIFPTSPLCNGDASGTATAMVSGNIGPVTYLWSTGATTSTISGLLAGTYSVIITDSVNLSDTAFMAINDPLGIIPNALQTTQESSPGNADGVAKSTPTNGTLPYTYLWSTGATVDSITALAAGNYTVTVTDANGCTGVESVTITIPPAWQFEGGNLTNLEFNAVSVMTQGPNPAGLDTASIPVVPDRLGSVSIADLDGDGDMDFVSGSNRGQFFFFENTGTPTVPHWVRSNKIPSLDTINISPNQVTNEVRPEFADIDADGDLDLIVGTRWAHNGIFKLDDFRFYRNTGTVTAPLFVFDTIPGTFFQQFAEFTSPAMIDIDADGDLDFFTVGSDSASYMENIGTATNPIFQRHFKTANILDGWTDASTLISQIDFNDFDGDGDFDIYYINEAGLIQFIPNNGTATNPDFAPFVPSSVSSLDTIDFGSFGSVDFEDLNGDGLLDFIACHAFPNTNWTWFSQISFGPSIAFTSNNISCNGLTDGSVTATASGNAPFFYQWSTGATADSIGGLSAGTYTVTVTETGGTTVTNMVTITEPALLVAASVVDSNISCNGFSDGGATASATGGTAPYTYAWSNSATTASITGVAAGTYTVSITDANGCGPDTSMVTITEPTALMASAVLDSNDTGGGTGGATASATGGTMPYTYLWSNSATTASITGVVAGTYTVTITDNNGCADNDNVTVAAGPAVSVMIDSNATCNGFSNGGATASANGGAMPYTYAWSNTATTISITGVVAGTYTVTVTDNNGLTATNSGTVTEPALLVAASVVDSNVTCNGFTDGGATASATGGTAPYTYVWSNAATTASITGVAAGTYTVSITDNNSCGPAISMVTITEPAALVSTIALDSNDVGNGGGVTASATGGTMPYTYTWSNSATIASITGLATGTYTVTITDNNGCTDTESQVISANPVPTVVIDSTISCNGFTDGGATAAVVGGTAPYTYTWSNTATTQSITGVVAGTYTVTVTDNNGLTGTAMGTITEPVVLMAASVVDSNVTCNGFVNGGATASATGGTAPYTYAWSNAATTASITGVAAGTYSVTITDVNGCTSTSSTMITQPDPIVFNLVQQLDVSCNGGSDAGFIYTISGGTPSISGTDTMYAVSSNLGVGPVSSRDTVRQFPAGLFIFIIGDSVGCISDTVRLTFTEPSAIVPSIVVDSNVSCNGFVDGGATVSATGGTAPYIYAWSNAATTASITGVAAGTYTVTITDNNGCTNTGMATITEPIVLVASSVVDSNVTCNTFTNGGATASATGGTAPYTYAWSNTATTASITGVVAGTYTVTITDNNGCTSTSSSTITEPAVLIASSVVDSSVTCNTFADGGATSSAIGGTAPYTYAWSNAATTVSITGVAAGTYTVTITDNNGCTTTSSSTITEPAVLVAASVIDSNATCLSFADGGATASATGGTVPYTYAWSNAATTASITGITNGTYTVTITDANGCTDTESTTITVVDTVKPTVLTQNMTVYLDVKGAASITPADIDNGSSDACGIMTLSLDSTSFDCNEVGANTVQLIANDVNGNIDSASAIVTVLDTIKPSVLTQDITVYLDVNGSASITTTDINNGSLDNCSIQTMSLDITSFTCSEVGSNTVQLIVTDANNNVDSASAVVTVLDTLLPTVITQNITTYLDANGSVSITTADINSGSSDNCTIQNMILSQSAFNCSNEGSNTVQLIVTDVNNNVDSASAVVTVLDTINPMISGCPTNINMIADNGSCTAVVTWTVPTAADNCTVDSLIASHNPGDVFSIGITTVTYIAYDPELNTDTCTFTVTVTDNEDPVIVGLPANITVDNDRDDCGAVVTWSSVTVTDNCTLGTNPLQSTFNSGDNFPIGTTTVTYTATDASMNVVTAGFTVTVNDTTNPVIVCPSNIAQCDSIVDFLDPTVTDNCTGFTTVRTDATGLNSGDQFPVGVTTLSYLVTDASNNQATCEFDIEVYAPAIANAGEDLTTRDIEPVVIEASSTNAVLFNWTPFESLIDASVEQPTANPQQTTIYRMDVTSPDGCTDSDEMQITVNIVNDLEATTLFSPNGDGMNDTWVVNKPSLIQGCRLIIVNRNGIEVYSTSNYNNEWDGTINGEQLPEGTYYYVFDCPDGRNMNGPITILRERR